MKVRYTYVGETAVEVVVDDDGIQVNLLPPEPVAPLAEEAAAAGPPLAAPPGDPVAAAPSLTKKRRTLMGLIRTSKTLLFTVGGEALVYVVNNLAGLNLPPGLGLAIGAAAYGVNKAIKPNGLL